ncbi:hypothetical protein N9L68_05055 [bacterium]|nr:hypothetical protein [bacterium]
MLLITHEIVQVNVFAVPPGPATEVAHRTCLRVQSELERWYDAQRRKGRDPTQIQHLEPTLFGTYLHQYCGLQAAETKYYLEFASD